MKVISAKVLTSELTSGHDYDRIYLYHIEYMYNGMAYRAELREYIHECISDFEKYYVDLLEPGSSFIVGVNENNPSRILTNMDFALIEKYKDRIDISTGLIICNNENGTIKVSPADEIPNAIEIYIKQKYISAKIIMEVLFNAMSKGIKKYLINCMNLQEVVPSSGIYDRGTVVSIVGWAKRYFEAYPKNIDNKIIVFGPNELIRQCKQMGTGIEANCEFDRENALKKIM